MDTPRKNEITFDPGSCSKGDIEEAIRRVSKWPERFATDNLSVGAMFDAHGEPIFLDGVLWAQAVVVEGEYLNGRVKVNDLDGLDLLIDQMEDVATVAYNSDIHLLVEAKDVDTGGDGDYKLELYAPWEGVSGWNVVGDFILGLAAGIVSWVAAGLTKVSATDTLAYLKDQFKDTTTYAANTHLLCKTEEVDTAGDKQIRISGDWSSVNSYSGSGDYILVLASGVVSWAAFSTADVGKVKVNSGDTLAYLEDQMANSVAIGSLPSDYETMKTFTTSGDAAVAVFWDYAAITGYSGGTKQYLSHDTSGELEWITPGTC